MSVLSEHYGMLGWAGADPAVGESDPGTKPDGGLRPRTIISATMAVFLVLLVLNVLGYVVSCTVDSKFFERVALLFIFDEEANFPTFFNFTLLVGLSVILGHLGFRSRAAGDPWWRHWLGLSLVFLLLSYDEAAQLHETLAPIVDKLVTATGPLYYSWVVPGAAFAVAVGLVYVRFVFALPRLVMVLTIVGGALYVGGALGAESISAAYDEAFGVDTVGYMVIATVEESMEMLGLVVFGAGLLQLLAGPDGRFHLGSLSR